MALEYKFSVACRVLKVLHSAGKLSGELLTEYVDISPNHCGELLARFVDNDPEKEEWVIKILCRLYKVAESRVSEKSISRKAAKLLTLKRIDALKVLPYSLVGNTLKVAFVDPSILDDRSDIEKEVGHNIDFELIKPSQFEQLRASSLFAVVDTPADAQSPTDESTKVKPLQRRNIRWNVQDDSLVEDFCSGILLSALETGTSDIHIEGFRDFARVRFRVDGVLKVQDNFSDYLFAHYNAVSTRFKIIAKCDISEKRIAQDGAITVLAPSGEDVDLRFNTVPTKYGERIVMRILAGDPALSLDKLGFDPEDYKKILQAITAPQGMVLVTGPTGSGKTTTLYGAIQYINKPELNILTAEDPIEYYLEGAGQVQANDRVGLTFPNILRSFLRQDPEVILVGEIRDQETVEIAIKAALTGHLLLSTLHTNDAISTLNRLLNMGVPTFMLSAALALVIAQRLARSNCTKCLVHDEAASPEVLAQLGFDEDQLSEINPMKGEGCPACGGTGYKGRRGIYEVLKISPKISQAILDNKRSNEILDIAKSEGFKTMQDIGRDMLKKHVISISEFQRTLVMDS